MSCDYGLKGKNVFMTGIAGSSMSGIAYILSDIGCVVSGSDRNLPADRSQFESRGIKVYDKHEASNIPANCDILVYTAAVDGSNPEVAEARRRGIEILSRAEFLGRVIDCFDTRIGVSGTHGKSTTSSMIATCMADNNKNYSYNVGCVIRADVDMPVSNGQDYFVFEACEYRDSFLNFRSDVAVILNVELEHLDYFNNLEQILTSFKKFANNISNGGSLVINMDDANTKAVADKVRPDIKVVTCSSTDSTADYFPVGVAYDEDACAAYTVYENGKPGAKIKLRIPGEHNVINSLCAVAAMRRAGLSWGEIVDGIAKFRGSGRRFDFKCNVGNIAIYDDYAHHPSEIRASINTAKKLKKPVCVIFQPHTFSRTKHLLKDEAAALSLADQVIMVDIYAAREVDPGDINSQMLSDLINRKGGNSTYMSSFADVQEYLKTVAHEEKTVITMGAGDVYKVADFFAK